MSNTHMQHKGLKNQGATDYLNAILQTYFFTPELRNGLYQLSPNDLGIEYIEEADKLDNKIKQNIEKMNEEQITMLCSLGYSKTKVKRAIVKANYNFNVAKQLLETNNVPSVKKILIQLRYFFALLTSSKQKSISTKNLTDSFGWMSREVRIQHDAHELNRILTDSIERSLKNTAQENLINNIYQGEMISTTCCLECGYCSQRKEHFLDAIVPVEGFCTLEQSLSNQIKCDYLVDNNKYFCDKCNKKSCAKRSVSYKKLPDVLTLALNRFVFDLYTMCRKKYTDLFEFPLIFDFEPYMYQTNEMIQTQKNEIDEKFLKENDLGNITKAFKDDTVKMYISKKRETELKMIRAVIYYYIDQTYGDLLKDIKDLIFEFCKSLKIYILHKEKYNKASKYLYELYGVLIHGGTPHAGHYHSYIRDHHKQWYDFNDSSVYKIPKQWIAKQYGAIKKDNIYNECAYMLTYRKINASILEPNMNEQILPPDLIKYVKEQNILFEQEQKIKEAQENEIIIKILNAKCFQVIDKKLTINPFIESLLKTIIRLSKEKKLLDTVIKNNEKDITKQAEEEFKEANVDELYLAKLWPINISHNDIDEIVQEHFKQNSVSIVCDGREPISKLIQEIKGKVANINNLQIHMLTIPSKFKDNDNIECDTIYSLLNSDISDNIGSKIYPMDKSDIKQHIIHDLPFRKFDFWRYSRVCFLWNGTDINGIQCNLNIKTQKMF
eukprot:57789_1